MRNSPAKPGRKKGRQSSRTTQSSLVVNRQKELSLEKNRIAAARCRIKKKEKNEQMLRDSRIKAQENKELRDLLKKMEIEMHRLRAILFAHSNSSKCTMSAQFTEALRLLQVAGGSKPCADLCDDPSSLTDTPPLSLSDKSTSSVSYGHSPATPTPSAMQSPTLDSYILGDTDFIALRNFGGFER